MHGFFFEPPIEQNFLGHQLSEIYKEGVYYPFVSNKNNLTILDIGANIGMTSYFFSRYANRVISLEPSKQHFEILTRMLSFNEITNVTAINKALYIQNGQFAFGGPDNNKTMRSLHTATWKDGKNDEMVEAITLKNLFEQQKIENVDIMKCDIEGTEYELFAHSDFQELAPKINTVILERHNWTGRNPNQLVEALKNAGYKVSQIPSNADLLVAQR